MIAEARQAATGGARVTGEGVGLSGRVAADDALIHLDIEIMKDAISAKSHQKILPLQYQIGKSRRYVSDCGFDKLHMP